MYIPAHTHARVHVLMSVECNMGTQPPQGRTCYTLDVRECILSSSDPRLHSRIGGAYPRPVKGPPTLHVVECIHGRTDRIHSLYMLECIYSPRIYTQWNGSSLTYSTELVTSVVHGPPGHACQDAIATFAPEFRMRHTVLGILSFPHSPLTLISRTIYTVPPAPPPHQHQHKSAYLGHKLV